MLFIDAAQNAHAALLRRQAQGVVGLEALLPGVAYAYVRAACGAVVAPLRRRPPVRVGSRGRGGQRRRGWRRRRVHVRAARRTLPHVPRRQGVPAAPVDVRFIDSEGGGFIQIRSTAYAMSFNRPLHVPSLAPASPCTRSCLATHRPTRSHPDPVYPDAPPPPLIRRPHAPHGASSRTPPPQTARRILRSPPGRASARVPRPRSRFVRRTSASYAQACARRNLLARK
jgi:hypothetical protein